LLIAAVEGIAKTTNEQVRCDVERESEPEDKRDDLTDHCRRIVVMEKRDGAVREGEKVCMRADPV
jgi:hypothetical protein